MDERLTLPERFCIAYLRAGMPRNPVTAQPILASTDALRSLQRHFPDIHDIVKGRRVIDFGCSVGNQSFAFADAGATEVLGVEIDERRLARARSRNTRDDVSFTRELGTQHDGRYDLAVSLNAFEHFPQPERTLEEIHRALSPGGRLLMAFGPLWWSAYGPHQQEFTLSPWPHLLFTERVVMKARGILTGERERDTYAKRGLNRMSAARCQRILRASPFRTVSEQFRCTRGLDALGSVPVLREVAINAVITVLEKAG